MLLAILTAWLAYKRAKENGRNGILWAIAGAATFVGTQFAVAFGVGVFLELGIEFRGWPESVYDTYDVPVRIVAIIASLFTSWLLLRFLEKSPAAEKFIQPPPPPPNNFDYKI